MPEERVQGTLWVLEDEPPSNRPRWWCHLDGEDAPGFEVVDDAVAWGEEHARTVVVRTLGGAFYFAGDRPPGDDWHDGDPRPWPPSRSEREAMDSEYHSTGVENARRRAIYTIVGDEWHRIANDLRTTTAFELELVPHHQPEKDCLPADSTWWEIDVSLNGVAIGSFGRGFSGAAEEFLAEVADALREFALDEEVGGGWPTCPVHRTHPLEAGVSHEGVATWFCPQAGAIAAIGSLAEVG